MKRYLLISIAGLFLVLVGLIIGFSKRLTPWINSKVESAVQSECKSCSLKIGSTNWSIHGVGFSDVQLSGGEKGGQWIEVNVESIYLFPKIGPLFQGQVELSSIRLVRPNLTFYDGEKRSPKKESEKEESEESNFDVRQINIDDGTFTYIRDVKGTHAVLVVHKLKGYFDPNENEGKLAGQFGKTGEFDLKVEVPSLKGPLEVNTDMHVHNQNLKDLSVFFEPNAGVKLEGILTKGHSVTKLRGRHVSASLWAEYKDFKLEVNKMYDRNEVQAFFTNLGTSIAMREKNTDAKHEEKAKTVEIDREPKESIVSFILRGLKEAAIAISLS